MFKVLDEVCTPKRGTKYSAYVDLFAREDVVIDAGETKIVKLGVKLDTSLIQEAMAFDSMEMKEFLQSHYLEVALRSSLAVKGLIIANGTGKVDLDYPDEIGLIVHNPITFKAIIKWIFSFGRNKSSFNISKGEKVAQGTIIPHKGYLMGYESDVERIGGFGSTGK